MGSLNASNSMGSETNSSKAPFPGLWITGIDSQYPPYCLGPEKLEKFARSFHDVEKPGLKKLLQINKTAGIDTRASVIDYGHDFTENPSPRSISELDNVFRTAGVDITVQACHKALTEWGGSYKDITHTVAVTCTNQGTPGYDLLVSRRLGIETIAQRSLLHGVGCAGGLAILRTAADIACGAAARGEPARVLAFACELCTPILGHELTEAEACGDLNQLSVAAALFGDGAAAFVLCNEYGMPDDRGEGGLFRLWEWGNATIPDTMQHMSFYVEPRGFRTVLGREVPAFTTKAIRPLFERPSPSFCGKTGLDGLDIVDFDWALHPGGKAIISGAQEMLGLTSDQLRATKQVYRSRGNFSSPTVLAVLDALRKMGHGKDAVVATAFGPGLCIEMALFTRCQVQNERT
ncbi:hypothetical protein Daus18300_010776 [Diaporthe australafricana]|uniref:Chalcone synthase n=1 Tax=Diaporthe australafricana TaxID=127596 RepID=A0ABR3W919_9PEZI